MIIQNSKFKTFFLIALLPFAFYLLTLPIPAYASIDLGQSRINPASPLYFLKSVREIFELKFAGTTRIRALRQLEFATRRIREVASLAGTSRQDLIAPVLERYSRHLGELRGITGLKDADMVGKVSDAVTAHMNVLQIVYQQAANPEAKRAIRTAVYRLSEWDQRLIDQLNSLNQTAFTQKLASSKLSGCNFLQGEASSSALNEVEKNVYAERASRCIDSSNSLF